MSDKRNKKKILSLDDQQINRLLVERVLGDEYKVVSVSCGEKALEKLLPYQRKDFEGIFKAMTGSRDFIISSCRCPKDNIHLIPPAVKGSAGSRILGICNCSCIKYSKRALNA